MARFLALSASVFTDPLLWDRAEYCHLRAAVDLCGLASFAKREFEEDGVSLTLEVRETRPLSVRWLMRRWGWKSTATVARFLSALETRTGTLTKHRTTRLGNTYIVGERLLAICGETLNETRTETPNETPSETKDNKDYQKGLKSSPPTGEKTPKRTRGSRRVPADWNPDERLEQELRSIAAQRGADYGEQMTMLRDHEFPRPYTDFPALARNWFRRANPTARTNGNGRANGRRTDGDWRHRQPGESAEDDPIFQR